MRRILLVLLASLLGIAACGGDDGPGLDEYADALATAILADDDDDALETTEEEAQCIGDATAPIIGLENLEATGTPEEVETLAEDDLSAFDLSDGAITDVVNATLECVDGIVAQLIEDIDTGSEEADDCLAETLEPSDLAPLLATGLQGEDVSEEDAQALVQIVAECTPGSQDDDSADERAQYQGALAELIFDDGSEVSEEEAACIASDAIDIVGRDRIVALGTPEEFVAATTDDLSALELTDDELLAVAQSYFDCAPAAVDLVRKGFIIGTELTGDAATCLADLVGEPEAQKVLALSLAGEPRPTLLQDLQAHVQTCA
ncbi:MAG: hypothetical protein OSA99_03950 [Acidimicrobiales bacterium]|nr:hypothetical protein [Acidimicrobiales bacterium]